MFQGCESLETAPKLLAPTLVSHCYDSMFSGCSSLSSVTCLATYKINDSGSTTSWLSGVANEGIFTKAAGVSWPSGENGIPSGWSVDY